MHFHILIYLLIIILVIIIPPPFGALFGIEYINNDGYLKKTYMNYSKNYKNIIKNYKKNKAIKYQEKASIAAKKAKLYLDDFNNYS